MCQNLKNYGVSLFLVKEKKESKNRLTPVLLGVSKNSIIRLDEKTKEELQIWPLTTIRRWAASKNSFSLDFGDFENNTYSVLTSESEIIAQLVSGYIELILSKKEKGALQPFSAPTKSVVSGYTNKNKGVINRRNRRKSNLAQGSLLKGDDISNMILYESIKMFLKFVYYRQ